MTALTSLSHVEIDLAPDIFRQRLIIEGLVTESIGAAQIADYLRALSCELDMVTILDPVTHQSDAYGWAGWIHWETSGAHFYAWDTPRRFFSADIYTCKAFDIERAVALTQRTFEPTRMVYRPC